jgi:hypothetical protein
MRNNQQIFRLALHLQQNSPQPIRQIMITFPTRVPMVVWIPLTLSGFFGPAGEAFWGGEGICVAGVKLAKFGASVVDYCGGEGGCGSFGADTG